MVRPTSVPGQVTVESGAPRLLVLSCPSGAVALNAVITGLAEGIEVHRSLPDPDGRRWRFALAAAPGGGGRASAVLRCVRLAVPRGIGAVRLEVQTRRSPAIPVAPGSTRRVELLCRRGYAPTGYGADGPIGFRSAQPTSGGWVFRLSNPGTDVTTVTMRVRCLERKVSGSGRALSFDVYRARSCGAAGYTLATAFEVGASAGPRNLLCLARESRFSRPAGR